MEVLEQLLTEFFGPATSTERKRSIEAQLESQRLSLDDCRYMLTNAQSDYLAWYAASQYQKRIQTEWGGLDPESQNANRLFLIHFLQQHFGVGSSSGAGSALSTDISAELRMDSTSGVANNNNSTSSSSSGVSGSNVHFSPFVLNKVVQLVTDIALLDWPNRFPDLFPEIHKLLQSKNKNHTLLGWTLLEAIVQEFVGTYPAPGSGKSDRVHLTLSQQKRYLWEHFKPDIPDLLTLIVQHLESCYNKMLVAPLATEAPAPSPVEHSIWGTSERRSSAATFQLNSSLQNGFSSSRAVPGSLSTSMADHSPSHSFGKSPTTTLRKSLNQFFGASNNSALNSELGSQATMTHSPAGSGISLLYARQRMGSISDLGQIAMRRSSINAAVMMESRRGSMDNTFISGNKMDSHSRKTCMLALQALIALLACPGLDPRQISFSPAITTILKFTTLHQNKTVDLGILALSCLNGLVARPGFLATNQDAMVGAVRIMADLIRYFNEVKDGIDDIDESYLQMFMHFVSLFCTLVNLERAEKTLGLSKPDFLSSFARFTLEKVSVDYLKTCMDVWKTLLEAIIHTASDISRPIPPQHAIRRIQGPLLYFMSALVEKFYKMKGAIQSEDAFSTFEVEDEEDLEDLTDLVESFVGLVAEVFTEEVIEMLNPLLNQQLMNYSRREIEDCKTLPVTLGILSKVAFTFDQSFDDRREYTSNLMIHLVRMTKVSIDYYLASIANNGSPGKDDIELTGTITLGLFNCLQPLIPWLHHLWRVETDPGNGTNTIPRTPIAQDLYQELTQLSSLFFQRLLPLANLPQPAGAVPTENINTLLRPVSVMDRKLLLISVKTIRILTVQVRIPPTLLLNGGFLFWNLDSVRELASCLSNIFVRNCTIIGLVFKPSKQGQSGDDLDEEERMGITPDDELFNIAYSALSNGITLDPKTGQELQAAAAQAFSGLVAPIVYQLQSALQESVSNPGSISSNGDIKFRIHRCLTILRSLIDSVNEAPAASRLMVYEGLKSALPIVQEYFEVYREDHDISIDTLLFFRSLVKSLYRQIGTNQCVEIARVLVELLTSSSLLDAALSTQPNGHGNLNGNQYQQTRLRQQSLYVHQQKILKRIRVSLSILKTILELPGKEITQSLSYFMQFLFSQLEPRLLGAHSQRLATSSSGGASPLAQQYQGSQEENGPENGEYELMILFFEIIKTLLISHTKYFFSGGAVMNAAGLNSSSNNNGIDSDSQRTQMLQSCMEVFARGLHRPEPEMVRRSIEILVSLQEHNLCHLFERTEFQSTFRFEFLQILLRIALGRQHDLLMEEIAGLIYKMVNAKSSNSEKSDNERFMAIWHGDFKQFVTVLEPSQVLVIPSHLTSATDGHSPVGNGSPLTQGDGSSPHTPQQLQRLQQVRFPDAAKETLWMDLVQLGNESMHREGLYEFVNDAHVYAQNLIG